MDDIFFVNGLRFTATYVGNLGHSVLRHDAEIKPAESL